MHTSQWTLCSVDRDPVVPGQAEWLAQHWTRQQRHGFVRISKLLGLHLLLCENEGLGSHKSFPIHRLMLLVLKLEVRILTF